MNPSGAPACGVCSSISGPLRTLPIWENERWHFRHIDYPYGVIGWCMLISKRHVAGPGYFDDGEAQSFGPTLRHLAGTLERVTSAQRIYVASMSESFPHFHMHLVPRYPRMEKDAKGWSVFDLQRAAQAGEIAVLGSEVERVVGYLREALTMHPPPSL